MPRRSIFTLLEREELLALPDNQDDLIRYYTLNEQDLSIIKQHRGASNQFGFAIQLCYLRYPGTILGFKKEPPIYLLNYIAEQLNTTVNDWEQYAHRDQTRRDHANELQLIFGFQSFTLKHYTAALKELDALARQTDKAIILAKFLLQSLRQQSILLPTINVIERLCSQAITQAKQKTYKLLIAELNQDQLNQLDALLTLRNQSNTSALKWLRQAPSAANAKHLMQHINRLKFVQAIMLPAGIEKQVHHNILLKLAQEGFRMTAQHLRDLENKRRYATLVAVLIETKATLIDEIINLHDRIMGSVFNKAKHKHSEKFQKEGKAINHKVHLYSCIGHALLNARETGSDPFLAIESIISWDDFTVSVNDAQKLSQPENFDYLPGIKTHYSQIRRYAPSFLNILIMKASCAAQPIMDAIETLRFMNIHNLRKLPYDIPPNFIKNRWRSLVFTQDGINRTFYEFYVLSELRNALRSGDIWVQDSHQFKDFDDYLIPINKFNALKAENKTSLAINTDGQKYINDRLELLDQQLKTVCYMAQATQLPDAVINKSGLKITPLENSVPKEAIILSEQIYNMLPRIKVTDLLMEVDEWTNFTRHFTHIKSKEIAHDKTLMMTVILADAINLGLTKMAESCPGTTYAKLSWLQAWYIRDETYSASLAEIINAQSHQLFAQNWGSGMTSSSDGQRFRTTRQAEGHGNINPKYGSTTGILFYSHISDQYAAFHTKVINVGVRDATYVLDGLLYHESDIHIKEHYTDTAGFTDHVFAMMHLLGFRFAPRIRDLADKRIFIPDKGLSYPNLSALIGGAINVKLIMSHWNDILHLATSIRQGTVTASLMLRKLSSYPRQNGLALALRELGRLERSLFTLDWLQSVELRRRVSAGLNKGESRNGLAKAVFFNRLGEIRERSFENQRYRASGLNLVTAAIILWNTVYLEKAIHAMKQQGKAFDESLIKHIAPLGWEHINLTGDYIWQQNNKLIKGKFKDLRITPLP